MSYYSDIVIYIDHYYYIHRNSRKNPVSCDQERQQRKNPPVPPKVSERQQRKNPEVPPKVSYDQARQQKKSSLPTALDRKTNRGNLVNGSSQNAPVTRGE